MLAAEALTALLELEAVGLAVTGARIVGRGSSASADLYLSDGSEIMFERIRDIGKPGTLAVEIAACTGATPKLTGPRALQVVSLMRTLAEHVESATADEIAAEWGTSFLSVAEAIDVDMNNQAARWAAFSMLANHDPAAIARVGGVSVARVSRILVGEDGSRYVRTGWFRAHVRAEDGTSSPAEIANRMQRLGWHRPGRKGRIHARRPDLPGELWMAFYIVPPNWETTVEASLAGDPLTPGDPSPRARAYAPARKENPPGVTRSPHLEAVS